MTNSQLTINSLAGEAASFFETRKRDPMGGDDGDPYVTLTDDAPEWLRDLVHDAHGDMLPDDWRYATIRSAVEYIAESQDDEDVSDLSYEFADSNADVYNSDLCAWLGSHSSRPGYCDEAADEGMVGNEVRVMQIIMAGQYMEGQEVFASVAEGLRSRLEAMEGESA